MDIEKKRKDIDEIDDFIVKLFLKRMQVCGEIGRYKKENGIRAYDEKRENEVFERVRSQTPDDMKEYIDLLYETVLGLSNAYQLEIINGETE
ncbi:MAG: chorismate mutase [Clostridia bacterium]|nr:chorismate mutase [Clostridia bacterium]